MLRDTIRNSYDIELLKLRTAPIRMCYADPRIFSKALPSRFVFANSDTGTHARTHHSSSVLNVKSERRFAHGLSPVSSVLLVNGNPSIGKSRMDVYLPGRRRIFLASTSGLRATCEQRSDIRPCHRGFAPLTILCGGRRRRRGRRTRGMSIGFRFLFGLGFRLLRGTTRFLVFVLLFLLLLCSCVFSCCWWLRGWRRGCTITFRNTRKLGTQSNK